MKATQASRLLVCNGRSSGAGVPGNSAGAAFPTPRRHPSRTRLRRGCRCGGGAAHPPLLSPRVDSCCCHTCGSSGGTPLTGSAPTPWPPRGRRRQTRLSCQVPCNGGGVGQARRRPGGRRPRHGDTGFSLPLPPPMGRRATAGSLVATGDGPPPCRRRVRGRRWLEACGREVHGVRGFPRFAIDVTTPQWPPPSWPAQDPVAADHGASSPVNASHLAALTVALRSTKCLPRLAPSALSSGASPERPVWIRPRSAASTGQFMANHAFRVVRGG